MISYNTGRQCRCGRECAFWNQNGRIWTQDQPLTSSVSLDKLTNTSGPQFPHLQNGAKNNAVKCCSPKHHQRACGQSKAEFIAHWDKGDPYLSRVLEASSKERAVVGYLKVFGLFRIVQGLDRHSGVRVSKGVFENWWDQWSTFMTITKVVCNFIFLGKSFQKPITEGCG